MHPRGGGHRRQTRAAHTLGIEFGALPFDKLVELLLVQQLIEAPIERVTRPAGNSVIVTHIAGCRSRFRLPMAIADCSTLTATSGTLSVCSSGALDLTALCWPALILQVRPAVACDESHLETI